MGKIRRYENSSFIPYSFYCRKHLINLRLKRVVKGQIWYYDLHTRLYRTDIKEIHLNRKQRQSIKNRCKL